MDNNYLKIDNNTIPGAAELLQQIELCQADDIVFSIATSGSQEKPKTALLSRNNIIAHCRSFSQSIAIDESSVWLNCMPMNHIAGVMIVYRCWYYKADMLLHDGFDVKKIWRELFQYQVTHISLVPRMLARLLDYQFSLQGDKSIVKSLHTVLVGGDRLSQSLYQRAVSAGWPVFISYGMTEAASTIAIGRQADCLKLLPGLSARVDTKGVLQLKGEMIISAYAAPHIKENRECFDQGWFKTSDLAQIEAGCLTLSGRNDHIIITAGKNISPQFVEDLLSYAPDIDDFAIGKYRPGESDNEWGDTIVVLISTHQRQFDIKEFKSWLSENIQSVFKPRLFIAVDQIPRNSLGKIERNKIQSIIDNPATHRVPL